MRVDNEQYQSDSSKNECEVLAEDSKYDSDDMVCYMN